MAIGGVAAAAPPASALNQGPILRVLRQSDVPGESNMYLPSGALPRGEFVRLMYGGGRAANAFAASLHADRYQSGAVSAFNGGDFLVWRSYAIALGTPRGSRSALSAAVRVATADPPFGSVAHATRDRSFGDAYMVNFSGGAQWLGGTQVLVSRGNYLYSLRCTDKPGRYHPAAVEGLLRHIIERG